MKTLSLVVGGLLAVVAATGCMGTADDVAELSDGSMLETAAAKGSKSSGKLNLSHIECTEDGDVLAHFVLLFAGSETPGALTGTSNHGAFGPVDAAKNSGNVWHYNVIFPSGELEILSATATTAGGTLVGLHNPGEYSGDYQCGDEPQVCPVEVEAQVFCSSALNNPGTECGHFGLKAQGKDDGLTGLSFTATQDAYVAIVKSGSGGCDENGASAYSVYVGVSAGDELLTPGTQDISHVTYCACPSE